MSGAILRSLTPGGFHAEGTVADDPREFGRRTREQAGLFNSILQSRRERKRQRFLDKLATGYDGPVILAEGDSWFDPISEDLLVPLGEKYAIFSLAKAGNSFAEVADQDELFPTLDRPPPGREFHIVMLSLGGNEVMGDIEDFAHDNDPARPDENYLSPSSRRSRGRARPVRRDRPAHRRERPAARHPARLRLPRPALPAEPGEPLNGAQWIGPPLMHERRIGQVTTWRAIANRMVDHFNAMSRLSLRGRGIRDACTRCGCSARSAGATRTRARTRAYGWTRSTGLTRGSGDWRGSLRR